MTVITIKLEDPSVHVSVEVAQGFPHGTEDFDTMVRRTNPATAVNGAYFSRQALSPSVTLSSTVRFYTRA